MDKETEFMQLVTQHKAIMYGTVYKFYDPSEKENVEDMVQEILMEAWKGYSNFKGLSKFSTWFYKVCFHAAVNYIRRFRSNARDTFIHNMFYDIYSNPEPDTHYNDKDICFKAIEQLKEIDRDIIALYLDGKSYENIAAITNMTENNLRVRINRIKERLRAYTYAYRKDRY